MALIARKNPCVAEMDARRRAKHDKNIDMKVVLSDFDEGADMQHWVHFGNKR